MKVTWKNTYYYAIREVEEDAMRIYDVPSLDVTYIALHPHLFESGWVHRRIQRMSRYVSTIEEWEYNMLDAVGVPHIRMDDVIKWGEQ